MHNGLQAAISIIWFDEGRLGNDVIDADMIALIGIVRYGGRQSCTEVFANLLVKVGAKRKSIEVLGRYHRLVVVVGCSKAVAAAIGATRNVDVMAGDDAVAVEVVLPVGIDAACLVDAILV